MWYWIAVEDAPEEVQKAAPSPRNQNTTLAHRLMLLVDSKARDTDLNKAVRRLRMQGQHELLVSLFVSPETLLLRRSSQSCEIQSFPVSGPVARSLLTS